jgi:hypothetical protein
VTQPEKPFTAFIVGNSSYISKTAFPAIPHCKSDAEAVFEVLTRGPAAVFDPARSVCHFDLTHSKLKTALSAFFQKVTKDDTVLVYFACHGQTLGGKYLALVMRNTKQKDLAGTGFDPRALNVFLDERQVKRSILILDCCRAGKFVQAAGARGSALAGEIDTAGLTGSGRWFVASCRDYEIARELEDLKHGLFTHYLVEGLRTGDSVTVTEEFIDVSKICSFASREIELKHADIAQTPLFEGHDLGGHPVWIAKNPRFKPQNVARFADVLMRNLGISELSDEAQIEFQQREKFREFVALVPTSNESHAWQEIIRRHGAALGLDDYAVWREILKIDARVRFAHNNATLPAAAPAGYVAVFSAGKADFAYASPGAGSFFGRHLLAALKGGAANSDGFVTASSAFQYVSDQLHEEMKLLGTGKNIQRPGFVISNNMDDFVLSSGTSSKQGEARRRALLIATDEYQDPTFSGVSLEGVMKETALVLETLGHFEVTSLFGRMATREQLFKVARELRSDLQSGDCLLFYFAGHSTMEPYEPSMRLVLADTNSDDPITGVDPRTFIHQLKTMNRPLDSSRDLPALITIMDTNHAEFAFAPM